MQRSVDFYTGVLGLRLVSRAGDHWAQLDAGGLTIGLHPASDRNPTPGTPGGITVGLSVDVPIAEAIAALAAHGADVRARAGRGRRPTGVLRRPRRQPALPGRGVALIDELRETVRRAYAGSGFFRALLSETGVGADGVDELARLPLTTTQRVHDHRTH